MNEQDQTRRRFITLGIGALAAGAIPATLIRRGKVVRRQIPVMGTIADLVAVHRNERAGQEAIDAAIDELKWVEATMSRFDDRSDVGRANLMAHRTAVALHPATSLVVAAGLDWARNTDGRFDPALGRVTRLWDGRPGARPPERRALAQVAVSAPYRSVELSSNAGQPSIRFSDNRIALDLGGIAKGYAVDRAANALRSHGVSSGMVNVGGDLYAIGSSPDGNPWQVGIRDPAHPDRVLESTPLMDGAIATSGDYLRYFEYGGRRYHHLIDPTNDRPRQTPMHSVTVAASDCMTADAAATAAFGNTAPTAAYITAAGAEVINRA